MFKKVFGAIFILSISLTHSFSQDKKQEKWVDSVYHKLSNEARIGQLFTVPVYSHASAKELQKTEALIKEYHIGGLIFMQGSPVKQIKITNRLQCLSKTPLLIGMDMEWGAGMRLDSTLSFPRAMALGAINDDSLVYEMAAEIAREMKILGVHMNFAPVADINTNPLNPVIGTRSFGSNKEIVANKAIAYMRGLQENGVLACAKHFPGHGDTKTDSHIGLPKINSSSERLDTLELYPFKKLMQAGVSSIMAAHIYVPDIDSKKNTPASLSEKAIHDILREKYDYKGLIITDALNMKAITNNYSNGEAEVEALKAGNDVLLFSNDIPLAFNAIKYALKKRKIDKDQLETSVKRILRAKYKAGLNNAWQPLNTENISLKLHEPRARALQNELYEKSVTVINNPNERLPIKTLDNESFASLSIGNTGIFVDYLEKYAPFSNYNFESANEEILYKELKNYSSIVIGIADIIPSKERYNVPAKALSLIKRLSKTTKVTICLLGSPYAASLFTNESPIICSYENNNLTQKIIPSALFGAIATSGRIPVTINKFKQGTVNATQALGRLSFASPYEVGMDEDALKRIDEIVSEAIKDQATPGCQIVVARKGKVILEKGYGYYTYDSLQPVSPSTIYDIASVTKVMASMQAFTFLVERGMIDLDKKASVYLPDLKGTNKENMIWRDILTHQAGLWPYLPFWKETLEDSHYIRKYYNNSPTSEFNFQVSDGLYTSEVMQDSLWQWIKEARVRDKAPNTPYDYKYSDMGYYILKRAVEQILNQPLDEFLHQNFYEPMGLTTTGYLPLCHFPLSRIAPTENDQDFRHTLVYGMVHDQGAALSGGIAGHAGLFSNALDLAKMLQMHLQDGQYGGTQYFQPGTIKTFTSQQYKTNRRGIGWDKPLQGKWYGPTSQWASPQTFGHTGFTGTAIWADPEFDLIFIFLSNRINPDANNSKLIKNNIRTRIQDVIYEAMWKYNENHYAY